MLITINYWAVLACGIVSMIIGSLWYGPIFGKTWVKLMNFSEESMRAARARGMAKLYILAFIGSLVEAAVLAWPIALFKTSTVFGAFSVAFYLWLGFLVPVLLCSAIWAKKSWKLYFLNIAYHLVTMFAMALVLTYWP